MNEALKIAIVLSGKRQRDLALKTGLHESRLSYIVNEYGPPPSEYEKVRIAKALKKPVEDLFPPTEATA